MMMLNNAAANKHEVYCHTKWLCQRHTIAALAVFVVILDLLSGVRTLGRRRSCRSYRPQCPPLELDIDRVLTMLTQSPHHPLHLNERIHVDGVLRLC